MRAQRLAKQPSPQRSRSPADSLAAWKEMQAGSELGQRFCLRFKLEPMSENGALRDPVAWRGIGEPHYKTGACMRVCVHPGVEICMFYLRPYNRLAQITLPKIQTGSEVGQRFV